MVLSPSCRRRCRPKSRRRFPPRAHSGLEPPSRVPYEAYLPAQTGHAMVCNRPHKDLWHVPMQRHCLDYYNYDSRGIVLYYRKSGRSAPRQISVWSEDDFRSQNLVPNLLRPDISPGGQPLPSRTSLKRLHTVCRSRCQCEAIPRPQDMPSHYWDTLFPPTLVQRSPAGDGPSAGPSSQRVKSDSPNPRAPSREPSTRSGPQRTMAPQQARVRHPIAVPLTATNPSPLATPVLIIAHRPLARPRRTGELLHIRHTSNPPPATAAADPTSGPSPISTRRAPATARLGTRGSPRPRAGRRPVAPPGRVPAIIAPRAIAACWNGRSS
jgi:hypothetical protein